MLTDLPTERVTTALRFLAAEAKLSQGRLAAKVGMSQSGVARRLTGDTPIDISELNTIAAALGYDIRISFIEAPEPTPSPNGVSEEGAPVPHGAPSIPNGAVQ